jgi:DDB1- and CUL4-associated factor 13
MKVQTLQRTVGNVERECTGDLKMHARNLDTAYHPLQQSREYQRAYVAAKVSRMFAQPLIGNIGYGHRDAVTCSTVSRRSLLPFVSGAADGTVALWDLPSRTNVTTIPAHTRTVTGVTFDVMSGQSFYSCSDDGYIHRWNIHAATPNDAPTNNDTTDGAATATATAATTNHHNQRHNTNRKKKSSPPSAAADASSSSSLYGPVESWRTNGAIKSIDHHYREDQFATASDDAVRIWTSTRSTPVTTFPDLWGSSQDTVTTVRYNPSEASLLAHCSVDRGIGLHDTRTNVALKKTVLQMRSNDLQWNPMEPMIFCVGNEDYNAYTFDLRQLSRPVRIYKGHTGAILSVAWSPTGREFVTGSYDRTLRIFPTHTGTSRDIYHTKRMQRLWTVQYSADSKFVISGSDDSNLRLWKATSNEQLGQLTTREESAQQYRTAIMKRYQHIPEVRTIIKSRKIPKVIQNQTQQAMIQKESAHRKQANRVKYNTSQNPKEDKKAFTFIPERDKVVTKEIE